MTEDEMAGWHYRLDGHEFECTPAVGDRQGDPVCCNSWGCKGSVQYPCLENLMDRGAWWAAVHGITQNRAQVSD